MARPLPSIARAKLVSRRAMRHARPDLKIRTVTLVTDRARIAPRSGPKGLQRRADPAWKAAKLKRIAPHECRHTFASIAIAAGVNIGTVSAALGHASVTITWGTYHHLMPGTMEEAASPIQAYVEHG
jgi:integrase